MSNFKYQPGQSGLDVIEMSVPLASVGTANAIRSREWAYEVGYRDLDSKSRPAYEVEFDFYADFATADALRRAGDADVALGTPGVFVAQDEWKQRGYIVASSVGGVHFGNLQTTLKAVLLDGAWWRLVTQTFHADDGESSGGFLDYAYDYAYDFMAPTVETVITPSVRTPSDVRIVVYGPATNPYIIVGANKYQVLVTVPSGGYLTVDGRDKTITLTLADGTTRNAFAYGLRGSGAGGGEYIFEQIQGESDVSWNGTFGFDLSWYEEEGEPPWSR